MGKINQYYYPYHWALQGFWLYSYQKPLDYFKKLLNKNDVVLDIGCGDGKLTSLISGKVKKVIGIDNQQFPLDMAEVIIDGQGIKNVEFENKDGVNFDYKDESFDKVVCFDMIEHIPEEQTNKLVKNIARVLKKDGWVCITTPNRKFLTSRIFGHNLIEKHYKEYCKEELTKMFSEDFKNIKVLGGYLPLIPLPKIEHYANILPLRYLFNFMVDLGKNNPGLSKTLILIAQKK